MAVDSLRDGLFMPVRSMDDISLPKFMLTFGISCVWVADAISEIVLRVGIRVDGFCVVVHRLMMNFGDVSSESHGNNRQQYTAHLTIPSELEQEKNYRESSILRIVH